MHVMITRVGLEGGEITRSLERGRREHYAGLSLASQKPFSYFHTYLVYLSVLLLFVLMDKAPLSNQSYQIDKTR